MTNTNNKQYSAAFEDPSVILADVATWQTSLGEFNKFGYTIPKLEALKSTLETKYGENTALKDRIDAAIASIDAILNYLNSLDFATTKGEIQKHDMLDPLFQDMLIRFIQISSVCITDLDANGDPVFDPNLTQTELASFNAIVASFEAIKKPIFESMKELSAFGKLSTNAQITSANPNPDFTAVYNAAEGKITAGHASNSGQCAALAVPTRDATELNGDFIKRFMEAEKDLAFCLNYYGANNQVRIDLDTAKVGIDTSVANKDVVSVALDNAISLKTVFFDDKIEVPSKTLTESFWLVHGCGQDGNNAAADLKLTAADFSIARCNDYRDRWTTATSFFPKDDGTNIDAYTLDAGGTIILNPDKFPGGATPEAEAAYLKTMYSSMITGKLPDAVQDGVNKVTNDITADFDTGIVVVAQSDVPAVPVEG